MLECKDLTIKYGKNHPVLRDIAFCAPRGAITAVLGANGCGKSSLLHAMMQELPYEGEILLGGEPLRHLSHSKRAQHLSLLPQRLPTPALTALETVLLGRCPHTTHIGESDRALALKNMERLGVLPLCDRRTDTLSGGERQKVFFAMLLTQDTPFLLLDEPTTYMDLAFISRFFAVLREEREKGKGILLVMHDVGDALTVADRVVWLQEGRVAFAGSAEEALEQRIPEKLLGLTRYAAQRGEKTAYFFKGE